MRVVIVGHLIEPDQLATYYFAMLYTLVKSAEVIRSTHEQV